MSSSRLTESTIEEYTLKVCDDLYVQLLNNNLNKIQEKLISFVTDLVNNFPSIDKDSKNTQMKILVDDILIDSVATGKFDLVNFIIKNCKDYLENKVILHAKTHAKTKEISALLERKKPTQLSQTIFQEQKNSAQMDKFTQKICQQLEKSIGNKLEVNELLINFTKTFPHANAEEKIRYKKTIIKDVFSDAAGSGKLELIKFISGNYSNYLDAEDLWHAKEYAGINLHSEVKAFISNLACPSNNLSL